MTPRERDRLEAIGREMQRVQRRQRDAAERARGDADRAATDRLSDHLRRRVRFDDRLRAAEIDPARWNEVGFWRDRVGDDAFDNLIRDVVGAPDEFRDFRRGADELLRDPLHWRVLRETLSASAFDAASTVPPFPADDVAECIAEAGRIVGAVAGSVEKVVGVDPAGFVYGLTPTGDLAETVDPDTTLGDRLGQIGTGLTDLFGPVDVLQPAPYSIADGSAPNPAENGPAPTELGTQTPRHD